MLTTLITEGYKQAGIMDLKDSAFLKAFAVVSTFAFAVVARNLLNEEKVRFRAFIGEVILAIIFGLLLVFLGVIRAASFPETMTLACLCGLGINKTVSWIAVPIIQKIVGKNSK